MVPAVYEPMATRSETSRRAILEATSALLAETTVQQLSIEAIAKRAVADKTTIYRWWPDQGGGRHRRLVEHHIVQTPISNDVPVPEALHAHLTSLSSSTPGPRGGFVAEMIAETVRRVDAARVVGASGRGAGGDARARRAQLREDTYAATLTWRHGRN